MKRLAACVLLLANVSCAFFLDIKMITWPKAVKREANVIGELVKIYRRPTPLDCYTELDGSFVGGTYRLSGAEQLASRSCLVRVPTHTLLTFNPTSLTHPNVSAKVVLS